MLLFFTEVIFIFANYAILRMIYSGKKCNEMCSDVMENTKYTIDLQSKTKIVFFFRNGFF